MTRYTVTAERGASGAWVFRCAEFPGAISDEVGVSPQRVSQLVDG